MKVQCHKASLGQGDATNLGAACLQEAFFQLLRLAGLLDAMPLPPGSAQADMVAASILQRATLLEREVCSMPLNAENSLSTFAT